MPRTNQENLLEQTQNSKKPGTKKEQQESTQFPPNELTLDGIARMYEAVFGKLPGEK